MSLEDNIDTLHPKMWASYRERDLVAEQTQQDRDPKIMVLDGKDTLTL